MSHRQVLASGCQPVCVAPIRRQHRARYRISLHSACRALCVTCRSQEKWLPAASSMPRTLHCVERPRVFCPTSLQICSIVFFPPRMYRLPSTRRAAAAALLPPRHRLFLPLTSGLILLFAPKIFSVMIFLATRTSFKPFMPSACSVIAASRCFLSIVNSQISHSPQRLDSSFSLETSTSTAAALLLSPHQTSRTVFPFASRRRCNPKTCECSSTTARCSSVPTLFPMLSNISAWRRSALCTRAACCMPTTPKRLPTWPKSPTNSASTRKLCNLYKAV